MGYRFQLPTSSLIWEQGVGGSNPLAPTSINNPVSNPIPYGLGVF